MAKGIEINGQLRGKRGGLVYYRQDGEQISRVRNTSPKNPRTSGQLVQRAVTATIMQAYSKGKVIFDHSFEGKKVPSGSQRAFMSENMKLLRHGILEELDLWNSGAYDDMEQFMAAAQYRVVSPYSYAPTQNPYIISRGSYKNSSWYAKFVAGGEQLHFGTNEEVTAETTIAEALLGWNLLEGDILTLCVFHGTMQHASRISSPSDTKFSFVRLIVKHPTAETIVGKKMSDVFELSGSGADAAALLADIAGTTFVAGATDIAFARIDDKVFCAGLICSRDDLGVRSNSQMVINTHLNEFVSVSAESLIESWKGVGNKTQSELILEGGNF